MAEIVVNIKVCSSHQHHLGLIANSSEVRHYTYTQRYSNTRRTDSKRGGSGNKWRVYSVLSVTNVPILNGKFIKGKTKSERQNWRGKWRRRRNSIQVSGSAQMRWGNACDIRFQRVTNGAFNNSHPNRSSRTGRYRLESIFRVKKHEFYTYHRIGSGSNQIELFIQLD